MMYAHKLIENILYVSPVSLMSKDGSCQMFAKVITRGLDLCNVKSWKHQQNENKDTLMNRME